MSAIRCENVIVSTNCYSGHHTEVFGDRWFFDGGDDEGYESEEDAIEAYAAAMVPHNGGPRPVARDEQVKYKTRAGHIGQAAAKSLTWTHDGGAGDIVAYEAIDGTAAMKERDLAPPAKSGALGTPRAVPLRDPWPVAGFDRRLGLWK